MKLSQVRRQKRKQAMKQMTARLTLTSLIDIFTLLVCFLLVGFQGEAKIPSIKGVLLPISSSYDAPTSSLTMVVTQTEIRIDEKVVMRLDGKAIDGSPLPPNPNAQSGEEGKIDLAPLVLELAHQGTRFKSSQKINGFDERTVIILADSNIQYSTLHQIMIVCSQQHFGRIAFAVNKEAKKNA
jgi:biopolymer transport protein ExbD